MTTNDSAALAAAIEEAEAARDRAADALAAAQAVVNLHHGPSGLITTRDRAAEALAAAQAAVDVLRGAQEPAARRERGSDGPAEPWRLHYHLTTASELCGALLAALETVRQDHGTVYGCEYLATVIGDHVGKALEGSERDASAA